MRIARLVPLAIIALAVVKARAESERADAHRAPHRAAARVSDSIPLDRRTFTLAGPDGRSVTMRATIAVTGDTVQRAPLPLVLSLHYSAQDTIVPAFYGASLLERVVLPALAPLGAIFVAPDVPGIGWGSPVSEQRVLALLDTIAAHYRVDPRRTLVTGYSLGGMGSWYMASRHPDRFRAAIPMASIPVLTRDNWRDSLAAELNGILSRPDDSWARPIRQVPWYILQSRGDATMPFPLMERFTSRLRAVGTDLQFVALDSIGHHETVKYREPLRDALPWIRRQWSR